MHVMAKIVEKIHPDWLLGLFEQLRAVRATAQIDIEKAKERVNGYRGLVALCEKSKEEMAKLLKRDGIREFAERYVAMAAPKCQEFDKYLQSSGKDFEGLKQAFGEDSMRTDEFFAVFATFLDHFEVSHNENKAEEERIRKEAEDERKAVEKEKARMVAKAAKEALAAKQTNAGGK
jgi:hypothetical protein